MFKGVTNRIYFLSDGHPGLVTKTLLYLIEQFYKYALRKAPSDSTILEYLMSENFFYSIKSTRAIPVMDLDNVEIDILKQLIEDIDDKGIVIDGPYEIPSKKLQASGVIANIGSRLFFSAPIVRSVYIQKIYGSSKRVSTIFNDMDTFLEATLSELKKSALQNTFSTGANSKILERQWQMEFYRSSSSFLPLGYSVSPDVGYVFGCKGFIDFFVDSNLKWGIEILREGSNLKKHLERFEDTDGIYSQMKTEVFKDYAVLDFRASKPQNLQDKVWYVVYHNDYAGAELLRKGKDSKQITFSN